MLEGHAFTFKEHAEQMPGVTSGVVCGCVCVCLCVCVYVFMYVCTYIRMFVAFSLEPEALRV